MKMTPEQEAFYEYGRPIMKNCCTCKYGAYFKMVPCSMCDDKFSSWVPRKEGKS